MSKKIDDLHRRIDAAFARLEALKEAVEVIQREAGR